MKKADSKKNSSVRYADTLAGECDRTFYSIPSVSSIARPFLQGAGWRIGDRKGGESGEGRET
jgi:hypothetical protein